MAVAAVPKDALMAINKAHYVLDIAGHMLEGEIALRERRTDAAVAALREAAPDYRVDLADWPHVS